MHQVQIALLWRQAPCPLFHCLISNISKKRTQGQHPPTLGAIFQYEPILTDITHNAGATLEVKTDQVTAGVDILYKVEQCGGSTPESQVKIHAAEDYHSANSSPDNGAGGMMIVGVHTKNHHIYRKPLVDLRLFMQPREYVLVVSLADEGGGGEGEASVHFEVSLPGIARQIRYHPSLDTLYAVLDAMAGCESGAHLRFGDGDIGLVLGSADQMQEANTGLASELQAALGWHGNAVFKTLPLNSYLFGALEPGMCDGNHLRCVM